ncbi:hypothetical protein JTF08_12070 [Micrococcaceae bacterium RIT802]|nr:hypothetical protein [Micrococcaceae bacterium RIT 802]
MTRHQRSVPASPPSPVRRIAAGLLGAFLVFAGASHLTFAREEFAELVPDWVPLDQDNVVVQSGIVEIALGTGLLALPASRARWGMAAAVLFVAVFPGNLHQFLQRRDAFGLDSDAGRLTRLALQPLLVLWALWSTGAWRELRSPRPRRRDSER